MLMAKRNAGTCAQTENSNMLQYMRADCNGWCHYGTVGTLPKAAVLPVVAVRVLASQHRQERPSSLCSRLH